MVPAIRKTSDLVQEITAASDDVFSMPIAELPTGGMISRIACGRMMRPCRAERREHRAATRGLFPA